LVQLHNHDDRADNARNGRLTSWERLTYLLQFHFIISV